VLRGERQNVFRRLRRLRSRSRGKSVKCSVRGANRLFVQRLYTSLRHALRNGISVLRRERLQDLHAAPMTMHVAEAADIHQNVKAQRLAGCELAQQLIMTYAMMNAEVDDLRAARFAERANLPPNLPVGIMTGAVQQRAGNLHLE